MSKLKWVLAVLAGAVLVLVGGTWVYINVLREDPPPPLSLDDPSPTTTAPPQVQQEPAEEPEPEEPEPPAAPVLVEGEWVTAEGSVVGYRVDEILFGQRTAAVGRTEDVWGELRVEASTVVEAGFEADMASVTSDSSRRDDQYRGRIMDVDTFPTASLVLVEPIELGSAPHQGERITTTAVVELTLRGTTRLVEIEIEAEIEAETARLAGSIPIVFEEWGIPNPSNPVVTTEDHGLLEFLLVLVRR